MSLSVLKTGVAPNEYDINTVLTALVASMTALEGLIRSGNNSPEGAVTAPVGTIYLRLNGSAGTILYTKNSGTGNTGWAPMVSA